MNAPVQEPVPAPEPFGVELIRHVLGLVVQESFPWEDRLKAFLKDLDGFVRVAQVVLQDVRKTAEACHEAGRTAAAAEAITLPGRLLERFPALKAHGIALHAQLELLGRDVRAATCALTRAVCLWDAVRECALRTDQLFCPEWGGAIVPLKR